MAHSADRADSRRWRRARSWAIALWLGLGLAIWCVLLDEAVIWGARDYLGRQVLSAQGRGPAPTIHGVMDPAIAGGIRQATTVAAIVCAVGLVGIWWAGRRRLKSLLRIPK